MGFKERLKQEQADLDIKIKALVKFLCEFDIADQAYGDMLNKQLDIMIDYMDILTARITYIEHNEILVKKHGGNNYGI